MEMLRLLEECHLEVRLHGVSSYMVSHGVTVMLLLRNNSVT